MKIGLIGVGLLGQAIAERLIAERFEVLGYDIATELDAILGYQRHTLRLGG